MNKNNNIEIENIKKDLSTMGNIIECLDDELCKQWSKLRLGKEVCSRQLIITLSCLVFDIKMLRNSMDQELPPPWLIDTSNFKAKKND